MFATSSTHRNESVYNTIPNPQEIDNLPNDSTTPRFPVKKTQVTDYDQLEDKRPIDLKDPTNIRTTVEYDPNTKCYIYKTYIGDQVLSTPLSLTSDEYLDQTRKRMMADYFKERNAALTIDGKDKKNDFALKDINVNLPTGGQIFGPGGVKIKATGYVELSTGIKYTSVENPTLPLNSRKRTSFDFSENIQMNATATVGNTINFDMNYDTKALFDFDSKKLKLAYDPSQPQFGGDDDGIIKKIEAGNVSMSTTNSLISGGTSLFGIHADLQFGKLRVNTVVSQQESQTRSVSSQGNIQTTNYEFKADTYDENRHFFLNHYFRNNYDKAMSKLPFVQSAISITRMEVWVTNNKSDFNEARNIIAFADLAENSDIENSFWQPVGTAANPYNNANNLYSTITSSYPAVRDINQVTQILSGFLVGGQDYEKVESARLLSSSEYTYNAQLGYVSLNSTLQAAEVLGVAYEYTMNGNTYQVGEFASDITTTYDKSNNKSGALIVRLLKPVSLTPQSYTWDLMMKNVYSLGASSIQKDKFRLNITYQSDTLGTYLSYLPEGDIEGEMLLRVMNLDRLDARENANPDGIFDYLEGYTIQSQTGRVYFPVVEPFGSYLAKKINNTAIASKYVYQELYDMSKTDAQRVAEKNKYKISGSYRGSASQSDISLNATNVAQGSVKVTAAGVTLTEGVDYIVDYSSGNVTLINQSLIDTNTPIQVSLEDNALSMQRKTLLGLNLSYDISKNFNIGATIMHLSEKPLTTKTTIGEESVKNTLWGLNASYKTQSLWLTNLIDKIPFVEASVPSQISFTGEFAQMIAGHYQDGSNTGFSYIDDFENAESKLDIKSPYAWSISSTPFDNSATALFPEASLSNNINYGINRAQLAWFMIDGIFTRKNSTSTPVHLRNDKVQLSNHFVREVYLYEIYPNKDVAATASTTLPVLNLSYYPNERGPYNLDATNIDSNGNLLNPEKRWAGIARKMDVTDFEASNIESIEFWLMDPFVYNSTSTTPNKGGDLYFNLGEISEDVLKDGKKFYENGLPITDDPSAYETTVWGRVPTRQSTVYAFDNSTSESRKKQDVGLNGLSTADEYLFPSYANYLTTYRAALSASAILEQNANPSSPLNDPSGDTYKFYRSNYYDEHETSILDRYKYYNGTEGNSSPDVNSENYSTAARSTPDVEDIDQNYTLNENEAYFQYKIELKPDKMNVGSNYIVDSREVDVPLRDGTKGKVTWYQFKVPVKEYQKRIGNIQDFKSIRFMRMFMTAFEQPTFLRFGTFQLVKGEWRIYDATLNANDAPSGSGTIDITTVNIEENSSRRPVNYIMPPGVTRALDAGQSQLLQENEQALSMRLNNLDAGDARAIYKNTSYDLRRYKRIQLFSHLEELIGGTSLSKGDFTVFLRMGSDYKSNYYEYEIPMSVTPAAPPNGYNANSTTDKYIVWPKDNTFDFPLELFKNVKLSRNQEKRKSGSTVSFTKLYSEYDPDNVNNKVSVIGNPSLAEVSTIMIGVRNNTTSAKSGIVWVNELRLTDFDEEGGWAAQGNLNIALSDLGTVNISGRKETVGFGTLDQRLQERRSDDYSLYNIVTTLDFGRFIPEKAKVSIPFYYSYSNQTTTPEYDPFDKDVKLKESLDAAINKTEKDSIKSLAQQKTTIKNISFNNVRVNIQSEKPMPYDPANFSFSYSSSITENKDPSTVYDQIKDYKANLSYSYSPIMKTWEPFKNVKGNKGSARFAKSIGFNYLPSNIGFNSAITRYYTETLTRDIDNYVVGSNNTSAEFLSWSQSFYWDRDFSLTWDFTKNLKFSIQTGTKAEIEEPYMQVNKKANRDKYEEWKDAVLRSIRRLGSPLEYRQTSNITYQLPFRNIPATEWINSNISYSSGYQWNRGAEVEDLELGNTITNNGTFDFKNQLNLVTLYNKSEFLKKVNQRFDSRGRNNQQGRNSRDKKETQKPKKRNFTKKVSLNTDSATLITHSLNNKKIIVTAKKTDGSKYNLKYKKVDENTIRINNKDTAQIQLVVMADMDNEGNKFWQDVKEYSARGLMSIRTIQFNYSHRNETSISGFIPSVGDAFGQKNSENGLAPGLGFAFGFDGGIDYVEKSLDRNWLLKNTENITPAIYNNTDKFELRAQIIPFKGMTIELNASREQNKRTELQYMYDGMPRTYGGSFSMTTIALSTALRTSKASNNYQSAAFDKFISMRDIISNRLQNKYNGTYYPAGGFMTTDNPSLIGQQYSVSNGAMDPNSGDVLVPAFIAAYTGKDANKVGLSAFPSLLSMLPNWSMTYDGLTNVGWITNHFKSIRLSHGYSCFYQVNNYSSFSSWVGTGDDIGFIRDVLSGKPTPSSPYSYSSVSIAEMFNPLIGLDGALNNNMTFNAQFNNYRTLNLSLASYQIIESIQKEIVVGLGYRINEFNRVIGLTPKKNNFNNDLNIKADIAHKTDQAIIRSITENFSQATSGGTTVTLRLTADYTLSRALTLQAFFDRVLNDPLITSTSYPTTNSNFGISIRFTLIQ